MAQSRRRLPNLEGPPLTEFVTADPATHAALRAAVKTTLDALVTTSLARPAHPAEHAGAQAAARAIDPCPPDPAPLQQVLEDLADRPRRQPAPGRPATVAHLHPAPLIAAAAAELAVGLTNQSMDAFDASPAATFVEDHLVGWLAREHGLGEHGSGVMTMGGTASNLLGLLLARDRAGENVRRDGLPPNALADRGLRGQPRQHAPLGRRCSGSAPRP